jgi:hypothetical protein
MPAVVEYVRVALMVLTQDSKQTIVERIARDPEFARALLGEAAT